MLRKIIKYICLIVLVVGMWGCDNKKTEVAKPEDKTNSGGDVSLDGKTTSPTPTGKEDSSKPDNKNPEISSTELKFVVNYNISGGKNEDGTSKPNFLFSTDKKGNLTYYDSQIINGVVGAITKRDKRLTSESIYNLNKLFSEFDYFSLVKDYTFGNKGDGKTYHQISLRGNSNDNWGTSFYEGNDSNSNFPQSLNNLISEIKNAIIEPIPPAQNPTPPSDATTEISSVKIKYAISYKVDGGIDGKGDPKLNRIVDKNGILTYNISEIIDGKATYVEKKDKKLTSEIIFNLNKLFNQYDYFLLADDYHFGSDGCCDRYGYTLSLNDNDKTKTIGFLQDEFLSWPEFPSSFKELIAEIEKINPDTLPQIESTGKLNAHAVSNPVQNTTNSSNQVAPSNNKISAFPLREEKINQLRQKSLEELEVQLDERTGNPHFIKGKVKLDGALEAKDTAKIFLRDYKDILGMKPLDDELIEKRFRKDEIGMTHIKYQQRYKSLDVYGSELIIHIDKDNAISSINGSFVSDISFDIKPVISELDAIEKAKIDLKASVVESIPKPELIVFNKGLITGERTGTNLVWKIIIFADDPLGEWNYFVDAQSGEIIFNFNNLKFTKAWQTNTAANGTILPGPRMWFSNGVIQTGLPTGEPDQNGTNLDNNVSAVYDYFFNTFGRDSFNGSGANIVASVHYRTNYNNAFWNGSQLVFGDGDGTNFSPLGDSLDVVAHEFAHGVTANEAGLVYSNQSGALNESYSDVFGIMVDRNDWLIGEDVFTPGTAGDSLRSLEDPALFGQPKHMRNYINNGDVHTNSGIPNHAAYRIATAIGKEKTERIYYRALTEYLTSSSQFMDARNLSLQACADLYFALTTDCNAVQDSFAVVGLGLYSASSWAINARQGTPIFSFCNDCLETINFPANFNFSFYGVRKNSLLVSSNGYVTFGNYGNIPINTSIPNSNPPNDLIAIFWDDLDFRSIDGVYWVVNGQSPNRIIAILWDNVRHHDINSTNSVSFQMQLYETSNKIEFFYFDTAFGNSSYDFGASATVGIENSDGTLGYQYSFNTVSVYPSKFNILYDLVLENETRRTGETIVYEANNTITAGANFTIDSGANVTMKAGSRIHLQPGFRAMQGSTFRAKIE